MSLPTPSPPQSPLLSGRILLVDDSKALLEVVRAGLVTKGWEVEVAGSGLAGLAAARRWKPDAVVCDLHMPEMDGYQVLRAMRQIDAMLPVIVHSGEDDLGSVLRAVREGAFDYVLKATEDVRPLLAALDRAVTHVRLLRENKRLTTELESRLVELNEQHVLLQDEQRRSDRLLLNILPAPIADRLKSDLKAKLERPRIIADHFPDVTVLFADIVEFTKLAASKTPEALVELLNEIFSVFDRLADRHGLEKIKTIGDAYMAAAGLPMPRPDHAEAVAEMALDMQAEVKRHRLKTGETLDVRIGIHTGPVIAGVIGERKFAYDLWGDTVNIASRMETQGVPGGIQCTAITAEKLKERFDLEERGAVQVKGKGEMRTFLLKGRRRWSDAGIKKKLILSRD